MVQDQLRVHEQYQEQTNHQDDFMQDFLYDFPQHETSTIASFPAPSTMSRQTVESSRSIQSEAVQSVMNAALLLSEPDHDALLESNHVLSPEQQQQVAHLLKTTNREEQMHRRKLELGESTVSSSISVGTVLRANQLLQSEVSIPKKQTLINVKETGMDSVRNYMKIMCSHELLNKNEEIILAREIQILVQWEKVRDDLELELQRYVVILLFYMKCILVLFVF